ncbi:MAG: glycosyltransferase [Armatimonadota bacterium]
MNILFIAPYVPSRIRVRPYHFLKELAKKHKLYVVVLAEPGGKVFEGTDEIKELSEDFRIIPHNKLMAIYNALKSLPTKKPMCVGYCQSSIMQENISKAIAGIPIDIIHIEHLRASNYSPQYFRAPIVFDSVDCLTSLFSQMCKMKKNPISKFVNLEETYKLKKYEPEIINKFNRTIITSEQDKKALLELDSKLKIDVVPNGVDTEYFKPKNIKKIPTRIIFSGKMGYAPNIQAAKWFANNVFPILKDKWQNTEFIIAGSNPNKDIIKLGEIQGITITGYVDDLRPYLESSIVAVAPMMTAVGVQNKILESMSIGLPVITTQIASKPLGDGCEGLIVLDNPKEIADEISNIIQNPQLSIEKGKIAREYVIKNFSWEASVEKLEKIYYELVEERKKGIVEIV